MKRGIVTLPVELRGIPGGFVINGGVNANRNEFFCAILG